jgi:hypothetical protein
MDNVVGEAKLRRAEYFVKRFMDNRNAISAITDDMDAMVTLLRNCGFLERLIKDYDSVSDFEVITYAAFMFVTINAAQANNSFCETTVDNLHRMLSVCIEAAKVAKEIVAAKLD